jgi:hypothetical protein
MTQTNSTRASQRAASVRTALVLALVALVLFGSIAFAQSFGTAIVGVGALAIAFIGFPLAALAGRIRK